jgi:hypothetical protein
MLEEIMMKKLITLLLVLAFAAPALADDIEAWYAPFRGDPGSTYSQWTYDDPCGVYEYDPPEVYSFVSHPEKLDPCFIPYGSDYSAQVWGTNVSDWGDPCMPWIPAAYGRTGMIEFWGASWDISNFIHEQPAKDIWVQITYQNPLSPGTSVDFGFGSGTFADPCAPPTTGAYDGPTATWPSGMEIFGTWEEPVDPCDPCGPVETWGWYEGPLDEWDPSWPDPTDSWGEEYWFDAVLINSGLRPDGWIHEVFKITYDFNPDFEWFEGGFWDDMAQTVLIDQIVIETLCYVPEPATMVLLGLGSLLMIRRKR